MKNTSAIALLLLLLPLSARAESRYPYHEAFAKAIGSDDSWKRDRDWQWDNIRYRIAVHYQDGNYARLEAMLDQIPKGVAWIDQDERWVPALYGQLRREVELGRDKGIAEWKKAYPNSAHPWIVELLVHRKVAFKARGSGFAHTVGEEGWRVYRKRIPMAVAALEKAFACAPEAAYVHVLRLNLDRHSGVPPAVFEKHYEEAKRIAPTVHAIHSEAFWYQLPRYYGTWEKAWKVVKDLVEGYPSAPASARLYFKAQCMFAQEKARKASKSHDDVHKAIRADLEKKDFAEAFSTLLANVRKKHPWSRWPALLALEYGKSVPLSDKDKDSLAYELAYRGDVKWMFEIASATFKEPKATPSQRRRAMSYLTRAFFRGSPKAKDLLVRNFLQPDPSQSKAPQVAYPLLRLLGGGLKWTEKDTPRYRALAIQALRVGLGVEKDVSAALAEHLENAKAGNVVCAYFYGRALALGEDGLTRDPQAARTWLEVAAKGKVVEAIKLLKRLEGAPGK